MVITCTCGQQMSVAQEDAGKTVQCPACGANIAVVAGPAVPPPLPMASAVASSGSGFPTCAIIGIVVAVVMVGVIFMVGILAAIMLPALARAREAARRASCQNNMKQVGLVMKMFTNESDGSHFPVLDPRPGRFMFDPGEVWGEYMTDASVMVCPSHSNFDEVSRLPAIEKIDDHVHIYLGYAVTNMDEARAFAQAYQGQVDQGGVFTGDLTVSPGTGNLGSDVIYRLREGVEDDLGLRQRDIPVLIERLDIDTFDGHIPGGGNVLYMDGHVEFIRYPGQFPMTREFMELIKSLED